MTATEELRRLLDERGVEYKELVMGINGSDVVTYYDFGDLELAFDEFDNGHTLFRAWNMTPAQAVNATLWRGECHMQLRDDIRGHAYQDTYECSECGEQVTRETYMGESEPPNYCPNCGRRYVG